MLRKNAKQQVAEKEQEAQLLSVTSTINVRRQFNILLVFMFMMQLFLPIVTSAADASDSSGNTADPSLEIQVVAEEGEESSDGDTGEVAEMNNVDDQTPPLEEPPAESGEDVVDEPVTNPEKNTNNPPPPTNEKEKQKQEKEDVGEEKTAKEDKTSEKENTETESEKEAEDDVDDSGKMLDGFPATEHPANATAITRFAAGSLGSAFVLLRGSMKMKSMSDLQPGEVRTMKTAERVPGMVNTWDVTVRIEGRDDDKVETTDVVLVIDRSGSMTDNNRMTNAKAAARNFIDAMIPADDNLRIAIVSFSSDHSDWFQSSNLIDIDHTFSDNQSTLKSAVNGLTAFGGTHTQAGIIQGQSMLTGSNADNKFMVLLSDGQPTYSYQPQNWQQGDARSWDPWWAGGNPNGWNYHPIYDGNFTNTVRGNGSDLTGTFDSGQNRYHIHNGDAAVKAGVDARVGFDGLFTIAVQAGSVGTPILANIASPGMAYSTQNPAELNEIYSRIGTQIATQSALRNVNLTDEMGDGFSLVSSTLRTTEGSTVVSAANGSNNDTITWTIDPAVSNLLPGTEDVRYAEMTYRVEINDNILDLDGAKTDVDKLFATNKVTDLTYTDVNDDRTMESITSPKVDPVLLKMKKILKDENGNVISSDPRKFNLKVSKTTPNSFTHTEPLDSSGDYVWLTTLRHEGSYAIEETGITGDGLTNLEAYTISYVIDGVAGTSFLVSHINNKPRGDITIDVTNRRIGNATPDNPLIRISKTFVGLSQNDINQLIDFKIILTSKDNPSKTTELLLADAFEAEEANGEITYKWRLDGWQAGEYTVTESGENLPGYDLVIENDGDVETVAAYMNWNNALWKKQNMQVYNDLNVNGIPANIVATKLSAFEGVFVWSETRLSASQRLAFVEATEGWNELGLTMDNGFWFSSADIAGTEFYFQGYRIQYDMETGSLHMPQANQWALIVSGNYSLEEGNPADITVKNTYTMNTIDFSFTKVDEAGNPLEGSEFTLETEEDGTLISNTGSDPEFNFANLTEGRYILREVKAPSGYKLPTTNWIIEVVRNEGTGELEIIIPDDSFLSVTDEGYQFENKEQGEFPQTGGLGVLSYFSVGLLTMMSSIGFYLKKEKNGGCKNE